MFGKIFDSIPPPPPSKEEVEQARTIRPPATLPRFQGSAREAAESLVKMVRRVDQTLGEAFEVIPPSQEGGMRLMKLRRELNAALGVVAVLERELGPKTHAIKCDPGPFELVVRGLKKYEVRRFDRDYQVGDYLELLEFDRATRQYSGRRVVVRVTAITAPGTYELPADIGVLGIELAVGT